MGEIVEGAAVCFAKSAKGCKTTRGIFLMESFANFRCGKCFKGFVIENIPSTRNSWYCPWCGLKQEFDSLLVDDCVDIKEDSPS